MTLYWPRPQSYTTRNIVIYVTTKSPSTNFGLVPVLQGAATCAGLYSRDAQPVALWPAMPWCVAPAN